MAEKKDNHELLPQIELHLARASVTWGDLALIVGASLAVALLCILVFKLTRAKDGNRISSGRSRGLDGSGPGRNPGQTPKRPKPHPASRHRSRRPRFGHLPSSPCRR